MSEGRLEQVPTCGCRLQFSGHETKLHMLFFLDTFFSFLLWPLLLSPRKTPILQNVPNIASIHVLQSGSYGFQHPLHVTITPVFSLVTIAAVYCSVLL